MALPLISKEELEAQPNLRVGGIAAGQTPDGLYVVEEAPKSTAEILKERREQFASEKAPKSTAEILKERRAELASEEAATLAPVEDVGFFEDVGKAAAAAVPKGLANIAGLPADLVQLGTQLTMDEPPDVPFTSTKIKEAIGEVVPLYEPKTATGKIVGSAIEFATEVPAMIGTGVPKLAMKGVAKVLKHTAKQTAKKAAELKKRAALAKAMTAGGAAGVTSESAGLAAEDTDYETVARVLGAIAGGPITGLSKTAISSLVQRYKSIGKGNAPAILNQLTEGITDKQFADAADFTAEARKLGIELSGDEALQLTRLKHAGMDTSSDPIMQKFIEAREGKVFEIGADVAKGASKVRTTPKAVAKEVTDASKAFIENTKASLAQRFVNPRYRAAKNEIAPVDVAGDMVSGLKDLAGSFKKSTKFKKMKSLAEEISEMVKVKGKKQLVARYEQSVENLDEVYRRLRDRFQTKYNPTDEAKEFGPKLNPLIKKFGDDIALTSGNIQAGRALHKRIQEGILGPLENTITGELTKAAGRGMNFSTISNILISPFTATPAQIQAAMFRVAKIDKEIPGKVARLHIEDVLEKAIQSNEPGKYFVRNTIGAKGSRQYANMKALMNSADRANGVEVGTGFRALERAVKVFKNMNETVGKSPPLSEKAGAAGYIARAVGYFNFGRGGLAGEVQRGMKATSKERTFEYIAEVLTSKDSLKQLEAFSKINVSSTNKLRNAFIALMIASSQETQ